MPSLAVPHFMNRGGDPVKSIRTIQLSGEIARDGFDPIEANANAVAVEDNPTNMLFQIKFEAKIKSDPDMAAKVSNVGAVIGTLSHGHLNCTMRNMTSGKKGCECKSTVVENPKASQSSVEPGWQCKCLNKKLLDKYGNYSMAMVRAHDAEWADLIERGIVWEMLSHNMDIEDPSAPLIISIALNKKK